jgi:hypothetical protein
MMNQSTPASKPRGKPGLVIGITLVGVAIMIGIGKWAVYMSNPEQGLPDLLGKTQPQLPEGALQVQDLQADPKGYTGSILVRGVVAVVSPTDPQLFGLIDSREARVCKDLHCAKWYLPVKIKDTALKPWDEVNVRGTMQEDSANQMVYLAAKSVENLGSIKK